MNGKKRSALKSVTSRLSLVFNVIFLLVKKTRPKKIRTRPIEKQTSILHFWFPLLCASGSSRRCTHKNFPTRLSGKGSAREHETHRTHATRLLSMTIRDWHKWIPGLNHNRIIGGQGLPPRIKIRFRSASRPDIQIHHAALIQSWFSNNLNHAANTHANGLIGLWNMSSHFSPRHAGIRNSIAFWKLIHEMCDKRKAQSRKAQSCKKIFVQIHVDCVLDLSWGWKNDHNLVT